MGCLVQGKNLWPGSISWARWIIYLFPCKEAPKFHPNHGFRPHGVFNHRAWYQMPPPAKQMSVVAGGGGLLILKVVYSLQ